MEELTLSADATESGKLFQSDTIVRYFCDVSMHSLGTEVPDWFDCCKGFLIGSIAPVRQQLVG